ncbi:hypothetical protein ANANG_G00065030 [Anguilla anguilla]|uniref:Uncharacterized protein n=1 Tax=Anguilla anguilla TaxID=7936 RepID=A0A9D3MPM6_ANGAN|nr:hypothetical protein ANANG_G00065030 [Anguilla anguilla]
MKARYEILPNCPQRRAPWEILRSIVRFGQGNFMTSFTPSYPEKLWIDEQAFCNVFPFHIVFDKNVSLHAIITPGTKRLSTGMMMLSRMCNFY